MQKTKIEQHTFSGVAAWLFTSASCMQIPEEIASDCAKLPRELEHQIRLRAHELYEARGREAGHELGDWLHAEAEITSKNGRTVAA